MKLQGKDFFLNGGSGGMVPKKLLPGVVVTLPGDGGSGGMVPTIFRKFDNFF